MHEPFVTITLSYEDAQALYEHTGTMPWVPGSWSKNVRDELSEALHFANPESKNLRQKSGGQKP